MESKKERSQESASTDLARSLQNLVPVALSMLFVFVFLQLSLGQAIIHPALCKAAILEMSPNEWGDFFAGLTAPIACIWFWWSQKGQAETLRLQKKMLDAQLAELTLQRQELTFQRKATEDMAEAQKRSTDIRAKQLDLTLAAINNERFAKFKIAILDHPIKYGIITYAFELSLQPHSKMAPITLHRPTFRAKNREIREDKYPTGDWGKTITHGERYQFELQIDVSQEELLPNYDLLVDYHDENGMCYRGTYLINGNTADHNLVHKKTELLVI